MKNQVLYFLVKNPSHLALNETHILNMSLHGDLMISHINLPHFERAIEPYIAHVHNSGKAKLSFSTLTKNIKNDPCQVMDLETVHGDKGNN